MTAMLDLTDKELSELKDLTEETDPSAALRRAFVEYIRHAKRMRLKELSDQLEMQARSPRSHAPRGNASLDALRLESTEPEI